MLQMDPVQIDSDSSTSPSVVMRLLWIRSSGRISPVRTGGRDDDRIASNVRRTVTPQVALSTSDWIFLSGVIVNGLAFLGVIVSLLLLRDQGSTQRDATLAVAYQNMAAQMADVARFFVDNSELRPFFFSNKALPASRDERDRVRAVAEMYVNMMDNVLTQSPVLKRAGIAADWEAYFLDVYRTSPVVREFWSEHGSAWYAHSPLASLYTPTRVGS